MFLPDAGKAARPEEADISPHAEMNGLTDYVISEGINALIVQTVNCYL